MRTKKPRTITMDDKVWNDSHKEATNKGRSLSSIIEELLRRWLKSIRDENNN